MRTLRKFMLPLMVALVLVQSSCTSNEYELYDEGNKTEEWENELRDIVYDLGFLFENSGVTFLQAEELNGRVDSTDFFNDETYYPICIEKLYNFFMLKNRDFVLNDTNTIHTPAFVLRGMVSNVINNQKDYDFVRLSWLLGEKKFQTVAAFDKSNGQIIYDNILTNIPWSQIELPSKKSKLTRAENGSGTETKIFFKDTMEIYVGSNTYKLWVKGICYVSVSSGGNYYNPVFSTVKKRTDFSPNRPGDTQYHPYADACAANNAIYYYVWVGIGTNTFDYSIGTDSERFTTSEIIWKAYTGREGHIPDCTEAKAEYVHIPSTMGNGLFEPEPSWNSEWNF